MSESNLIKYNSLTHNNLISYVNPNNFNSTDRNRYIQSKGHTVEALYTVLCDQNFFSRKDLNSLNKFNSHFIGHPTRKVPGIEHNTGALGHGLSVAVGMAIGFKLDNIALVSKLTLGSLLFFILMISES